MKCIPLEAGFKHRNVSAEVVRFTVTSQSLMTDTHT